LEFYHYNFPLLASIFAEQAIFDAHRRRLSQLGVGPHKANHAVAGYLRGEQKLGRVRADADADASADLLMGACFQHAFLSHYQGRDADAGVAPRYAALLMPALLPDR